MLQVNPGLTPDQVKYRLMNTARWSASQQGEPVYNTFQQGLGRIWAPDAVLDAVDPAGAANLGMDLNADLAHGYDTIQDLAYHYQGPVQKLLSDDGSAYLFYAIDSSGTQYALGVTTRDGRWLDAGSATRLSWAGTRLSWAGGLSWSGDSNAFSSTRLTWAGTRMTWAGTRLTWAGTRLTWAGTRLTWAGGINWTGGTTWGSTRLTWAGSNDLYANTRLTWAGSIGGASAGGSSIRWIDDNWVPPSTSNLPPPAGASP
jgi:serine protease AprX